MIKILITGGAGFIGSSLAEVLLKNPKYQVVIVDNLLTGDIRKVPIHENCKFIKCDVNDYKGISAIMTAHAFHYVFHYAAVVGVERTIENPLLVMKDIDGIKNILDLSKNTGVERVFYSSSSEIYGEPVELPQNESTTPLNSKLPYAIVKNLGEAFCRSYSQEHNLKYTIFRFFNTYGSKQSTDFVISKFIKLAKNNDDITVYGDGSQSRTFCFIEDNLKATIKALESNLFVNDVVNIGNDKVYSILELANIIIDAVGSKSKIIHLPPLEEGDMTRRMPDITKMRKLVDVDLITLEEGMSRLLS